MKKPTQQQQQQRPARPSPPRIAEDEDDDDAANSASVDIEAVTRALGLSFLGSARGGAGAADDSSSSSSESSDDESDDDVHGDATDSDAAAAAAAQRQQRRTDRAAQRARDKQRRKFAKKLRSRSDLDAAADGNSGSASARGSSAIKFPSLASAAVLKFKRLPGSNNSMLATATAAPAPTPTQSPTLSMSAAASATRALRALHKRSDPCLMGESQSLSSEEDDDEKRNYGTMQRDVKPPPDTVAIPTTGDGAELLAPVPSGADAFDAELGLAAPAVMRLRAQSSSLESGGLDRLTDVDKELLANMRSSSHVQRVRSMSDTTGNTNEPLAVDKATQTTATTAPHRLHRSLLRVWGKINNSYFAYWLVVCSVVVLALDVLAVVFVRHAFNATHDAQGHRLGSARNHTRMLFEPLHLPHPQADADDDISCDWRLQLLRGMHFVGLPNVLLVVPVLSASEHVALYKRKDNRIVRCAYLQVCEVIVTAQMAFMIYFAADQVLNLPETLRCHATFAPTEIAMLYSSLVMWCVLMRQIVLFCRFVTHQKLQADGANDANHTSAMNSWLKRIMSWPGLTEHARRTKLFKKRLYRAVVRGDIDAAQKLLDDAPDVYGIARVGELYRTPVLWGYAFAMSCKNPLHVAAMLGNTMMVHLLLLHGFDVNALDKVARVNFNLGLIFKICTRILIRTQDGLKSPLKSILCTVLVPPIHGAVASGHVNVVRLLLEHGADVNALSRASFYYRAGVLPPIFVADDPQVLQLLVAHGANFLHVASVSLAGLMRTFATPLQRAAFTMRSSLSDYLVETGADVALTPLHAAAAAGNTARVKSLLAHGTAVDTLGERVEGVHRRTPLHWAAIVGELASAQLLLRKGADPNAPDRDGRTPLHWAAHNDHSDMVNLLLASGADANAKDNEGNPVLCFAAEAESVSVHTIASLVGAGASLKFKGVTGDTALHIALQRENRQTALSLIKCGANMMATNSFGKRPVDCTTSTELQFKLKKEAGSRDVMISYTHTHFAFAQHVREYLENHCALTCWMDTMDPSGIGGGAVWREEIARGIQKCSVVLSLVCDGYTKSEWCLKELALAKNIRKPVVGLIVEEGSKAAMAPLETLVPVKHRILFNDFITAKHQDGRKVLFEINDVVFASKMQTVLPVIKTAMTTERRLDLEEKDLLAHDKSEKFKLRMMTTVLEDAKEEDDEDDGSVNSAVDTVAGRTGDNDDDSDSSRHVRFLQRESDTAAAGQQVVRVYAYSAENAFAQRVMAELTRFGVVCEPLDPTCAAEQLSACRCLVLVVEAFEEKDRHARKQISAALTRVVQAAHDATPRVRVLPVLETRHFLDLSKMYSLARSEFFYFVDGVGRARSKAELIIQLRNCVAR